MWEEEESLKPVTYPPHASPFLVLAFSPVDGAAGPPAGRRPSPRDASVEPVAQLARPVVAASTSDFWKLPTFLLLRNRPTEVSMSVCHALFAVTPCHIDPASLSLFHCWSAHAR